VWRRVAWSGLGGVGYNDATELTSQHDTDGSSTISYQPSTTFQRSAATLPDE
jgi:hypothetical protein